MKLIDPPDQQPNQEPDERPELTAWDIVMGYFDDSALWPILIVIVVHIVAIVGFAIMLAVQDRNFAAMGAVVGLLYASFAVIRWEWRKLGALRSLTITTAIVWILSALVAYYGQRLHFL